MRLAVTAGFNRSLAAIALCELLRRSGHQITCVIVVTPFNVKRIRALILQRGIGIVKSGLRKLLGRQTSSGNDPLSNFLVSEKITERSLNEWVNKHGASLTNVKEINGENAVQALQAAAPDAVIYAGGGILRKPFIRAANRKIINPHCGPLPEVRGMNAIEWTALLGCEPAITVHYIDEGIDTGDIIERHTIPLIKSEHIDSLRARAVVAGVTAIIQQLNLSSSIDNIPRTQLAARNPGRQCYTMSPVLKELLQYRLNRL
jgi:folate-dependent phosphoribosylglycinamide formyltransferase PurN